MMRLARLLLAVAALALPAPATATPASWTTFGSAIGTPTELGKSSVTLTSNPQTLTTTTIADGPAGNTNLIIVSNVGNPLYSAGYNNDSAGNAYNALGANQNTVDLPNGGSFSVTYTCSVSCGTFPSIYQIAYNISGLVTSGSADTIAGNSGTSTAPTVTESAPTNASRIVFGYVTVTGGVSDTFTEASGWTTAPGSPVTLAAKDALHVAYKIVNSGSAQTYNPTLGTSRAWQANVIGFDGK